MLGEIRITESTLCRNAPTSPEISSGRSSVSLYYWRSSESTDRDAGNQNAYLVKRNSGGGVQFSRDPFNLTNKHSRKHAGFVNDKAVSVVPNEKGGVTLVTKKSKNAHQPSSHYNTQSFKSGSSNRKCVQQTAGQLYCRRD